MLLGLSRRSSLKDCWLMTDIERAELVYPFRFLFISCFSLSRLFAFLSSIRRKSIVTRIPLKSIETRIHTKLLKVSFICCIQSFYFITQPTTHSKRESTLKSVLTIRIIANYIHYYKLNFLLRVPSVRRYNLNLTQ